jgi:hypothetical protein
VSRKPNKTWAFLPAEGSFSKRLMPADLHLVIRLQHLKRYVSDARGGRGTGVEENDYLSKLRL